MNQSEYLTVESALTAVLAGVSKLDSETVPLIQLLGRILAEPVVAQHNMPPFSNSAMDGYALRAEDIRTASPAAPMTLDVVGDVAAGDVYDGQVDAGTAVRIMTGAPLPVGANAVIPVEDTDEEWRQTERPLPQKILVRRSLKAGDYIRHPGEDIVEGMQILEPGHLIRPQEIGVLASLGVTQAQVVRQPKIGILATGDELIPVDAPLTPGKIRNSNGYAQTAQVMQLGAVPIVLGVAFDTEKSVREKLYQGIEAGVDLFISSAGVSVGAYDVVKTVLEADGNVGFWRVRMRPGKPLAFGTYQGIPYLGLPGNPVSAMVSFERFARPAILKMGGHARLEKPLLPVMVQEQIESDGRESYIRAVVKKTAVGYEARTTGGQGSHMLTSLTKANALLIIPEGQKVVQIGEILSAWMLDWPETVF